MYKHTVTYENFNGETESRDLYFHLGKVDQIRFKAQFQNRLQLLQNRMQGVNPESETETGKFLGEYGSEVFDILDAIIGMTYGVRSEDGTKFVKNNQLFEEFKSTPAYDAFLEDLLFNPGAQQNFLAGISPKGNQAPLPFAK